MYYQGQRVVTQTPPSITPARAGGGAGVGGLDGALKAVLAQTYIMTGRYLTNFFFNFCIPPDPGPLDIHAFDKTFTLSR